MKTETDKLRDELVIKFAQKYHWGHEPTVVGMLNDFWNDCAEHLTADKAGLHTRIAELEAQNQRIINSNKERAKKDMELAEADAKCIAELEAQLARRETVDQITTRLIDDVKHALSNYMARPESIIHIIETTIALIGNTNLKTGNKFDLSNLMRELEAYGKKFSP